MKNTVIAAALGALLAVSPAARADAFARAYNNVTNMVITVSAGVTIGETVDNSSAGACLANGVCVAQGGAGMTDTPAAHIGLPGYVNNSYVSPLGVLTSYAVADSSIDWQQLQGAPSTQARSLAEAKLLSNTTANANSGNSSASFMSTVIEVDGGGATIGIRFDATPYIQAYLSANSLSPAQAEGTIALNFNIIDNNGNIVFNWTPDGFAGGITGGTESADAYTLNTTLTALPNNTGPLLFNPMSCPVGSLPDGCFNATTERLAAGIYSLNMSMSSNINLQSVVAVPEPHSYAMAGAGLALLGFMARRRRRRTPGVGRWT